MSDQRITRLLVAIALLALFTVPCLAAEEDRAIPDLSDYLPEPIAHGTLESPDEDGDVAWYLDEEMDLRYRVEKVPNRKASYKMIDEKRAKFPYGAILHVVSMDEQWVYVKMWEPKEFPPAPRPIPVPVEPTAEEVEKIAASYEPKTELVDRFHFKSFDNGLPDRGQWRNGFEVADMNRDGHLDIVFGPSRKGRAVPNIFLGDSQGNWKRWQARYPNLPYDYGDVAVADFNGDDIPDLAMGFHLRGLAVLVGDGNDGFTPWTEGVGLDYPGFGGDATSFSSRMLRAYDWNGDGRPDIVALGEGPKGVKMGPKKMSGEMINTSRGLLVYLNNGDGTWTPRRPQEVVDNRQFDFGDDFVIADFNADKRADVVTATSRVGYQDLLNIGQEDLQLRRERIQGLRPGAKITAVASADLNQDGKDDLVVSYINSEARVWRSGIDILLATEDLGFERKPLMSGETRTASQALAIGRLDNDEHWDIVSLSGVGQVDVFFGDGKGFMVAEKSPEMPPQEPGCRGFYAEIVDIDRDGVGEIIAAFAGEPTGYPGVPGYSKPGCQHGGSIRVWKADAQKSPATETLASN